MTDGTAASSPAGERSTPRSGQTVLRLAYRRFDGFQRALEAQVHDFTIAHPDVRVDLVEFEPPALYEAMVTDGGLTSGEWDLALLVTDWLPQAIESGQLACLDDALRTDGPDGWPDDFSAALLELQHDEDGRVFGLPYHDGPQVLVYRRDLFSDPDEQIAYRARFDRELRPPRTWAEFLDVARFFHRPSDGLHGCVVAGYPDAHNTVYDFLLHLWSRGGDLLNADGHPIFDGAAGVEALTWLRDLLMTEQLTQPDPLGADSVKAGEVFATGAAAMMWNWLGFAVVADMPNSPIRGKVACAPLPGNTESTPGRSLNLYWVLVQCRGSAQPDLAWQLLRQLSQPSSDRIVANSGAVAVRLSSWRDPDVQTAFAAYRVIEQAHRGARSVPRLSTYPTLVDELNRRIDEVYRHGSDPSEALEAASADYLAATSDANDGAVSRR